jgi:uncharacterized protein YjbI with pentapeptide repeats
MAPVNNQSTATESDSYRIESVESVVKQPDELPSEKHPDSYRKKKLSWDMSRGNWLDADFSGLKNLHEKFSSSNMQRCKFIGSDLTGLLLKGNNVDSCDFSGSNFSSSHIQGSNLVNNLFKDCSLREAKISESYISGCDFSGVEFTGVEFKFGGLTGAVAKSGDLEKNAIANAVWNRKSLKRIRFINCQADRMTYEFLKNGKADLTGITLLTNEGGNV